MSNRALSHVFSLEISKSSHKFVLVALANYADNETLEAYPCIVELCEATSLNRKTVLAAISALRDENLIIDTGKRRGSTKSVTVYKINLEAVPKTEPLEGLSSPKNGTTKQSQKVREAYPKTGRLNDGEVVPKSTISSPVFTNKQSQKRDTEPSITIREPSNIKKLKQKKDTKIDAKKKPPDEFILPDWINPDDWDDFMETRRALKAQNSIRAKNLLISELEKVKASGNDPNEEIRRSIMHSWKSIYPQKPQQTQGKPNATGNHHHTGKQQFTNKADSFRAATESVLADIEAGLL